MKKALIVFAVALLLAMVVLYGAIIATLATSHQPKSNWHWPAGEVSIEYFER